MEATLIIIGMLFIIAGIIGCIIPGIPGPPLAFVSLILLEFTTNAPFSFAFMAAWGLIAIAVTLLDYYVPIWGTQKFGGSKYGMWGSIIGLIIGLFTGPFGIIIGPFLGAYIGELIGGMRNEAALKAGLGAFLGFIAGTIMKLGVSFVITFYYFTESWQIVKEFW